MSIVSPSSIGYTLPWLKQPTAQIFFNHHQTFHHNQQQNNLSPTTPSDADNDKNATMRPYYKSSAFKPVLGAHRTPLFNENLFNSPLLGSALPLDPNSRIVDINESTDSEL